MAASLRSGLKCLFQNCRALSQSAALLTGQGPAVARTAVKAVSRPPSLLSNSIVSHYFGSWSPAWCVGNGALSQRLPPLQATTPLLEHTRSKVRYSRNKGKPQTVHSVVNRFYRLHWGIWIRTRAGRGKRLWTKHSEQRYRLRQHVFCNKQQSKLLDKMVTDFWKRPRHYVDDPYEPYQQRQNLDVYFQQKRPFFP